MAFVLYHDIITFMAFCYFIQFLYLRNVNEYYKTSMWLIDMRYRFNTWVHVRELCTGSTRHENATWIVICVISYSHSDDGVCDPLT